MPSPRVHVLLPRPCGGYLLNLGEKYELALEVASLVFFVSIQHAGAFPSLEVQVTFAFFFGNPCNIPQHLSVLKHQADDLLLLFVFDPAGVLPFLDAAGDLALPGTEKTSFVALRILLRISLNPFDLQMG